MNIEITTDDKLRMLRGNNNFLFLEHYDIQNYQIRLMMRLYALNGYDLVLTSFAFPEQFDVLKDGVSKYYIRVRHGVLRMDDEISGNTLLTQDIQGDGTFSHSERMPLLVKLLRLIQSYEQNIQKES